MSANLIVCSARRCDVRGGRAPAGEARLVIDIDSFVGEVHGHAKQGAGYGYTQKRWIEA